jgi:hypothetical protein
MDRESSLSLCCAECYIMIGMIRRLFSRLLFSFVICLLLFGILSTEIPELLSLTDNTSNDFAEHPTISAEAVRIVLAAMPDETPVAVRVAEHEEMQFWTVGKKCSSPTHLGLFILHSILRR